VDQNNSPVTLVNNNNQSSQNSGLKKNIVLPVIVLIITILALSIGFFLGKNSNIILNVNSLITPTNDAKSCTLETKICPDGSSVGRTGPNCEFTPCPTINKSEPQTSPIDSNLPMPGEKENMGKVEGKLCFPSEYIPKGYILAKNTDTGLIEKTLFEGTPPKDPSFSFSLPPGNYIFAYAPDNNKMEGFYTPCAKTQYAGNCETDQSHQLTEVNIIAGRIINNIDICDYYYQPAQKPAF
jgi:hypothetical protein